MLIVTSTVYGKREPMNTNNVENYNERYSPERETYVIRMGVLRHFMSRR